MAGNEASQELFDQQLRKVTEFVLRTEDKFVSRLPDDIFHLQQRLLRNAATVPGYSLSNPLDFCRLLRAISHRDHPTVGEIGEALSVAPATATRAVNFLEKNDWAERQPDASDGRRIRVILTDEGQENLDMITQFITECHREILGYLTPQERSILVILLDKILNSYSLSV